MDPKRRKFKVLDVLVLIAAVGIGLAWMRQYTQTEAGGESYPDEFNFRNQPIPSPVRAVLIGFWWVDAIYNIVAPVTLAMLLLRALPPRPSLRRLARQPGAVACAAVAAAVLVEMLSKFDDVVAGIYFGGHHWYDIESLSYWIVQGSYQSLAVCVAWLLLSGSGRWKLEKSWIDRLGLVLGVFWLVVPPLEWVITRVVSPGIWQT